MAGTDSIPRPPPDFHMDQNSSDFPFVESAAFVESLGGDAEACLEIARTALQECEPQIAAIDGFSAGASCEAVARAAHSLRGAAATFSAARFTELLHAIETAGRENRPDEITPRLVEFPRLASAYREALRRMIAALGG